MSMILEYQKAVFTKLISDSGIVSAIEGVYDIVPQDALAPYIFFGNVSCQDISNLKNEMCKITFEVICVTESAGKKEAAELADLVRKSLHLGELSLGEYEHINTKLVDEEITLSSNGITYFAELKFEAVVSA